MAILKSFPGSYPAFFTASRIVSIASSSDFSAGEITQAELRAAQEAICSSLRTIADAAGRMEDFALFRLLSRFPLDRAGYRDAVLAVTADQVAKIAAQVELDTIFFLKGASV